MNIMETGKKYIIQTPSLGYFFITFKEIKDGFLVATDTMRVFLAINEEGIQLSFTRGNAFSLSEMLFNMNQIISVVDVPPELVDFYTNIVDCSNMITHPNLIGEIRKYSDRLSKVIGEKNMDIAKQVNFSEEQARLIIEKMKEGGIPPASNTVH